MSLILAICNFDYGCSTNLQLIEVYASGRKIASMNI